MRQSQPNAPADKDDYMEIATPVLVLIILGMLIAGLMLGMFVERLRWNELIQRGILPSPSGQSRSRKV